MELGKSITLVEQRMEKFSKELQGIIDQIEERVNVKIKLESSIMLMQSMYSVTIEYPNEKLTPQIVHGLSNIEALMYITGIGVGANLPIKGEIN